MNPTLALAVHAHHVILQFFSKHPSPAGFQTLLCGIDLVVREYVFLVPDQYYVRKYSTKTFSPISIQTDQWRVTKISFFQCQG